MPLPRFNLREMLMLLTIIGLSIPYVLPAMRSQSRMDLSYNRVLAMVTQLEPQAKVVNVAGGDEQIDLTCLVPADASADLFERIHRVIRDQIEKSGWVLVSSRESRENDSLARFDYELWNSNARCVIQAVLIEKKKSVREIQGHTMDEVRFIILSPHLR